MSTPNLPVYVRYIGNENATEFSVTFPYIDKKYVKVYLARERTGNPELLDETRYSFVNDTTIKFPTQDSDTLLGYNDALIILRKTDLGSDYDFDNQRRLFPEDVMDADDLAFQQIQELAYEVSRAVKTSIVGEETADDLLNGIHDSVNRASEYAAKAEENKLSAEQFANDAETGANIANSSAAKAQESALEAMSAKEYAEQAVMNENLITVANDLDSQDSNIKAVAQNMQSVKDAIISAERAAQSATEAQWYASQLGDIPSKLPIKVTNISVASGEWMPSTMYAGFGYEVMIHIDGVKSSHTPTVIFDIAEATSGNFAPIAIAEDEAVTIFAKEQPSGDIVIPVIVLE
jgi:hypothetical protein